MLTVKDVEFPRNKKNISWTTKSDDLSVQLKMALMCTCMNIRKTVHAQKIFSSRGFQPMSKK